MCSFITQHTAIMVINSEPVACWLQGMSTRAGIRELNAHFVANGNHTRY